MDPLQYELFKPREIKIAEDVVSLYEGVLKNVHSVYTVS